MKKRSKNQKKLLNELRNNPLIERACKKVGIARSTFYRWSEADLAFKEEAEAAIAAGRDKMNDFSESKLFEAIAAGNMQAIRYWLDHNSKRYAGVSASELKRLRFFETLVFDLLDKAAARNDHEVLKIIVQLREQAERQIEEKKGRTEI